MARQWGALQRERMIYALKRSSVALPWFDQLFGIEIPTVWNQQVEVGEPDFHQLEPDGELAQPAPGAPKSRIVKRGGVYEALPADRN